MFREITLFCTLYIVKITFFVVCYVIGTCILCFIVTLLILAMGILLMFTWCVFSNVVFRLYGVVTLMLLAVTMKSHNTSTLTLNYITRYRCITCIRYYNRIRSRVACGVLILNGQQKATTFRYTCSLHNYSAEYDILLWSNKWASTGI